MKNIRATANRMNAMAGIGVKLNSQGLTDHR
jgi:hypothetical protein